MMNTHDVLDLAERNPHLTAVMTAISNRKNEEPAAKPAEAYFYQLRAAHSVDVFEPFKADHVILNSFLSQIQAGKDICKYAWELYTQKTAH